MGNNNKMILECGFWKSCRDWTGTVLD